jgi:hypothetical protein
MFYIDLWAFTNDPLYLGYNSTEQQNLVLCVLHFERPIQSQIELGFLGSHFSPREASWTFGPDLEGLEAQKRVGCAPSKGARHPASFGSRSPDLLDSFANRRI